MSVSPRIVLTDAAANAALRTKVERAIEQRRRDDFWLAVQEIKQPGAAGQRAGAPPFPSHTDAARRRHAWSAIQECAGSTPAARSNVVEIRR